MIMLAAPLPRPVSSAARPVRWLAAWRQGDPLLFGFGLLTLALMLPTGFAAAIDDRLFNGIDIWIKVLKFEAAIALYVLTLALYSHALPEALKERRWFRVLRFSIVATLSYEIAVIGGAAVLGTASHFNPTPLGQVLYAFMGLFAVFFTSASGVYAWAIVRNPRTVLSPVLKESLATGLALTVPLTLLTAGTMGAMGGHHVGVSESDAGGMFLLGWSRSGGDLRAPHFLATHAMHAVPAFGLLSERLWGGDRKAPVWLFAAGFTFLVLFAFAQALGGKPFLPFIG